MASKNCLKVRLVSTGKNAKGKKTGTFYTTTRNSKIEKLLRRKFDRRAYDPETGKTGMHVDFKEEKIK